MKVPPLPFSEMRRPNSENCRMSVAEEQALVTKVVVKRRDAVTEGPHQPAIRAATLHSLSGVSVETAGLH